MAWALSQAGLLLAVAATLVNEGCGFQPVGVAQRHREATRVAILDQKCMLMGWLRMKRTDRWADHRSKLDVAAASLNFGQPQHALRSRNANLFCRGLKAAREGAEQRIVEADEETDTWLIREEDPQSEEEHKDRYLDKLLQRFLTMKLRDALAKGSDMDEQPEESDGSPEPIRAATSSCAFGSTNSDFDEMMDAAVALSRRPGWQTQMLVSDLLRSLFPSWFPQACKWLFQLFPSWFLARHATASTVLLTQWLVGFGEINDIEAALLDDLDADRGRGWGQTPVGWVPGFLLGGPWRNEVGAGQGVLLKKCRVLESSGCASVCANVCKGPTQAFFNEDLGLPLTMIPNYVTSECQFCFGVSPPDLEQDDAFVSSCLADCKIKNHDVFRLSKSQTDVQEQVCGGLRSSFK